MESEKNYAEMASLPGLLTREALAQWLSCSLRQVDELREKAGLPWIKVGRLVRFNQLHVLDWLDRQKNVAPAGALGK